MKEHELHWVAGLLEGEGCFTRKSNGTDKNILISCHMTDEDVLLRLQSIIGGRINGPYSNGGTKKKPRKPRWGWFISGKAAYDMMKILRPLMGTRRQFRIDEIIRAYDSVTPKLYNVKNIATGEIIETDNIYAWCKNNGMTYNALYKTMIGLRQQCKGFKRLK